LKALLIKFQLVYTKKDWHLLLKDMKN